MTKTEFPTISVVHFAFLGPLVGSLARPVGGWAADRWGGARITIVTFVIMVPCALAVLWALQTSSWAMFLTGFLLLFAGSGAANGSVFRMIPHIMESAYLTRIGLSAVRVEAAGAIGIASAVGAFGGFLLPRVLAGSINSTGSPAVGFALFAGIYAVCTAVTWACYMRGGGVAKGLRLGERV